MRAQSAASEQPFSFLTEHDLTRVRQVVQEVFNAKPLPDPDQMIGFREVLELRKQILGKPTDKTPVRQTAWKDVAKGIIPEPERWGARTARWRRGDVVAGYKAHAKA